MERIFNPRQFGALGDGITLDTKAIQAAIDEAGIAAERGAKTIVVLSKGIYLTSSLFLKSHMEFRMEEGAILLGTTDESQYPIMHTRVAGVEMEWTVGILNVNGQEDVKITGKGCIDGQGPYWWNKYWGEDRKGGMRKVYEAKGLRWCVDYDCRRSRNLVVMESKNVNLSDFESRRSGFWNIHICYSKNIHVEKLHIYDNEGPSTDGIDIDSCDGVVVERCKIACNDDSICVKSGRDADGTDCGFRLKSARTRGGVIEDVLVENLKMVNVKYPFSMCLDWNPSYSYCEIPKDYQGEIPEHWRRLAIPVPEEKGIPQVKNLIIRNVISENEPDYAGISRAFDVSAFPEHPITHVTMENIKIQAKEFGKISGIKDWKLVNVEITTEE